MCLHNATIVKADFKVKKYWKTFYVRNGIISSVVYNKHYKNGWNYPDPQVIYLEDKGIHCFNNQKDAKFYRDSWGINEEVVCSVYCLGSDLIATGYTEITNNGKLVPSTTFNKVFIRRKDYEKLLKGESVHD